MFRAGQEQAHFQIVQLERPCIGNRNTLRGVSGIEQQLLHRFERNHRRILLSPSGEGQFPPDRSMVRVNQCFAPTSTNPKTTAIIVVNTFVTSL